MSDAGRYGILTWGTGTYSDLAKQISGSFTAAAVLTKGYTESFTVDAVIAGRLRMFGQWSLRLLGKPAHFYGVHLEAEFESFDIVHGTIRISANHPLRHHLAADDSAVLLLDDTVVAWIKLEVPRWKYPAGRPPEIEITFSSFTKWYLGRRHVTEGFAGDEYEETGAVDTVLTNIVKYNGGSLSSASRQFSNFTVSTASGTAPSDTVRMARQELLPQFIKWARYHDVGFHVVGEVQGDGTVAAKFETWYPLTKDYSHDNTDGNDRVVYSLNRGNVSEWEYFAGSMAPNVVYVYGEGEGQYRTVTTVGSASGDSRYEAAVDARQAESSAERTVAGNRFLERQGESEAVRFKYVTGSVVVGKPLVDVWPDYTVTFYFEDENSQTVTVQKEIVKIRVKVDHEGDNYEVELGHIRTDLDRRDEQEDQTGSGGSGGGSGAGGGRGGKVARHHNHSGGAHGPKIGGSGSANPGIEPGTITEDDLDTTIHWYKYVTDGTTTAEAGKADTLVFVGQGGTSITVTNDDPTQSGLDSVAINSHSGHSITGSSGSAGGHTHSISGSTGSAGSHSHSISGSTGGGLHGHSSGTLSADSGGSHTHGAGTYAVGSAGSHTHSITSDGSHNHTLGGSLGLSGTHQHLLDVTTSQGGTDNHTHTVCEWVDTAGSHNHGWGTAAIGSAGGHSHGGGTSSAGSHTHSITGSSGSDGSHTHSISGSASSSSHTHTSGTLSADSGGSHSHSVSLTSGSAGSHTHDAGTYSISAS